MSQENFEHFQTLVLRDISLQKRLRAFVERPKFIHQVVVLAEERGYKITAEEVERALRRSRRVWIERWM